MVQQQNFTIVSNLTTPAPGGRGCPPVGIQLEGLIMPPVLIIDVVLGLIGNLVALWIFCFKMKAWNPNTLFLFNLVIADFFALVSLPLRIDALLRGHWVFGDGICRINLFLMFSNRSASIALMTVVAIYRYFKVRKTLIFIWKVKGYFCKHPTIGVSRKNCFLGMAFILLPPTPTNVYFQLWLFPYQDYLQKFLVLLVVITYFAQIKTDRSV